MNKSGKYIVLALLSLIIAIGFRPSFEDEFYVFAQGTNSTIWINANGDFANGFSLTSVSEPQITEQTSTWTWEEANDYIEFRDSTTTDGFRLQVYLSSTDAGKFVYLGSSTKQANLDPGQLKIWAGYSSTGAIYQAASVGLDDPSTTVNIDSANTCANSQILPTYDFNNDLLSGDFGLVMSSVAQNYLLGDNECPVQGTVDIRRMELTYPGASNAGTYEATFVVLIVDGN